MKKILTGLVFFTSRHVKLFFIIALTLLIFSILSSYTIEPKSNLSIMWIGLSSFFAGATAGGIGGALIGGIGIAAMGTAVGISGLTVVGLGILFGGTFFGAIGTGIGAYLSNPERYDVNWIMLLVILAVSYAISFLLVSSATRGLLWIRTRGII